MHLNRLFRSSPFRLAVAYVALFGSSALVLMAFIYWSTAGFMLRQADETIEAEIAGLAERYQIAGMSGLTSLIEEHPYREHLWYLLIEALAGHGRRVEALRACRRLRNVLAEVGVQAADDLHDIEQQILEGHALPSVRKS